MELEKQANLVGDIRAELMDRINTRLKVRANMGRSKIVECEGTLMQAHPALFVVEVDRKRIELGKPIKVAGTSTFLPAWSNCSTPKRKSPSSASSWTMKPKRAPRLRPLRCF